MKKDPIWTRAILWMFIGGGFPEGSIFNWRFFPIWLYMSGIYILSEQLYYWKSWF